MSVPKIALPYFRYPRVISRMASESQWAEQELVFMQQLNGELSYEESWGKHVEIINRYDEDVEEEDNEKDPDVEEINDINGHENNLYDSDFSVEEEPEEVNRQVQPNTLAITKGLIAFSEDFDDKKIPCPLCGYRAKQAATLQVHVQMNHLNLYYFCKVCNYKSKEIWALRKHIHSIHKIAHKDVESLMVSECGICKWTGLREETDVHITELHPEFEKFLYYRKSEGGAMTKDFKCRVCHADFSGDKFRSLKLSSHMQTVHIKAIFKCDNCFFEFRYLQLLYSHIQQTHIPENLEKSEERECKKLYVKYKCHICSFELAESDKKQMFDHMQTSHELELQGNQIPCERCDFVAGTKRQLIIHMMKRHEHVNTGIIVKYQCPLCEYKSEVFRNLSTHMHSHLGTSFICNICYFTSKHKLKFQAHFMTTHTRERKKSMRKNTTYHCALCDIQAGSQEYDEHMIKLHNHPVEDINQSTTKARLNGITTMFNECPHCDFKTRIRTNLRVHMHKLHTKSYYACTFCEFTAIVKLEVSKHLESTHKNDTQPPLDFETWISHSIICHCKSCNFKGLFKPFFDHNVEVHQFPPLHIGGKRKMREIFQCAECLKKFYTKEKLVQHASEVHLNAHYNCNICDVKFLFLKKLREHTENEHSGISSSSTFCGKCNITIQDNGKLDHFETDHDKFIFSKNIHTSQIIRLKITKFSQPFLILNKCKFCQSDADVQDIKSHVLLHLKTTYTCKECNFSADKNISVLQHTRRSHKHIADHLVKQTCGLCKKVFTAKETIDHIESHESELLETQYSYSKCDMCQFKSISTVSLKKHKALIHDIKPHNCNICGVNTRSLVVHNKKNHPDFQYTCEYLDCNSDFKSKHYAALWRHMNEIHEGKNIHKCKTCGRNFRRLESLNSHEKIYHNPNVTDSKHNKIRLKAMVNIEGNKSRKKKMQRRRLMRRSK